MDYFPESKVTVSFLGSGSFYQKEPKNFECNFCSSSNLCIQKKFHAIQKRDASGLGVWTNFTL